MSAAIFCADGARKRAQRTTVAARRRWLLLACLLAAVTDAAEPAAPAALAGRLDSLSGAGARDCGVFPLRSDLAAAIACARDAMSSGRPYRLAVQLQGIDSAMWQGAARDERGRLWVVFYDADSSGGATPSPTLSVVPCSDIVFALHGGEVLDCQPYSGTPWHRRHSRAARVAVSSQRRSNCLVQALSCMKVPSVEDVVSAIEHAFAAVPRGAGITLHEADAIDKKLSDAERAQLRDLDTESRWEDVPAELIARFSCQLALVDGEGYRYYIPAFMRWVVTHYGESRSFTIDSTIYSLEHVANPGDCPVARALPLLSAAQRCAIAKFLLHMSTAAALHADAAHAQQALDRFWGRYAD